MDVSLQEEIYREYYPKIFSYIRNRISDRNDAEDLTSEVFTRVIEKYDSYDQGKASLSTWIYQITKNAVIDFYRKYKTVEELPGEILDDTRIDKALLCEETLAELEKALKALPKRQREIIIYRYYHEYTFKDIEKLLSMSYGIIKYQHKKALETLKDILAENNTV